MSKFRNKTIFSSMVYAYRGIAIALKTQRNFRFDFLFGIIVIISAFFLHFKLIEMAILILTVNAVLFAELINTVIEFVIDAYYGNRYSIIAKVSKDIAAGAVLITAICSFSVGLLLFLPKILKLIHF